MHMHTDYDSYYLYVIFTLLREHYAIHALIRIKDLVLLNIKCQKKDIKLKI